LIHCSHVPRFVVEGDDALGSCDTTASLDGVRELVLLPDGRAVLTDTSPMKEGEDITDRVTEGGWRLDESSKSYTVTFNGEDTTYLIAPTEHISICMLIKGSLGAADLRASWFSSPFEAHPPYYEPADHW
jgi:hypothetical protein